MQIIVANGQKNIFVRNTHQNCIQAIVAVCPDELSKSYNNNGHYSKTSNDHHDKKAFNKVGIEYFPIS